MADTDGKAPQAAGNTPGAFVDPFLTFNFKLMITGITEAHFTQCSGLGVRIETTSYVEAGNPVERQIPGRARHDPVTLKYGFTQSQELWDWMMSAVNPPVQRKDVQVIVLDADGITETVRWTLYNAWPSAWRAEPLDTNRSGVAIHEMELVYETLDRQ
jgi:phage tail-like protein